jgi:hypothetical protein
MEQFEDLVAKKGIASALREEAGAALSHPLDCLNSIKKPIAEATVAVAGTYLAHRFGPAAVEEGAKLLSPLAKELGASFNMDALTSFGPRLALVDGVALDEKSSFTARLLAKTAKTAEAKTAEAEIGDKPMFMASTGNSGGGVDFNYRQGTGPNGEVMHSFDNVRVPNVVNNFTHGDMTTVYFGHEGGLYVQFPGSTSSRILQFGRNIDSVQIKEAPNGLNEYRFNGENRTAMLVNPANHDVIGYPANGDRIIIADNQPAGLVFNHSRGGAVHISAGGQIEIMPPSGATQNTSVGQPFSQAYITEHIDGAISLRFTDQTEQMISGEVRVEASMMAPRLPVPTPRFNNSAQPSGSSWRLPLEGQSPVNFAGDNVDFFRYDAAGGHNHHDVLNPFNIPTSPERAIDMKLTGVPGGMVSGSRLDAPADMFTAQMAGDNRWLGRWLVNLGKPEISGG